MRQPLPSYDQAYGLLSREGRFFPENSRVMSQLGDLSCRDSDGVRPLMVEDRVLAAHGRIYAEPDIRKALAGRGIGSSSLGDARRLLHGFLSGDGQVWGFSGFATAGFGSAAEASVMVKIYDALARDKALPKATSDGASSPGVLGLNGIIARKRRVTTIGYGPRAGMDDAAPRDHYIVRFNTFREREKLVGSTPDALVCAGGAGGTEREAIEAAKLGSALFIVSPKPNNLLNLAKIRAAAQPDRLVIWKPGDKLEEKVAQVLVAAELAKQERPTRKRVLSGLLAA